MITPSLEVLGSVLILGWLGQVLSSVQFHNEVTFMAAKINDPRSDGVLAEI
jgi:hypothetical protein